jgi:hypothetical protein
MGDREKLIGRKLNDGKLDDSKLEEGEFYGISAIRPGQHMGNVSVVTFSRSSSPAPSYKLAPGASVVDWTDTIKNASPSSSRNGSISSLPRAKTKPSPLHLQPSLADLRNSFASNSNVSVTSFGEGGGVYMAPPLPSPKSFTSEKNSTWVNPLDVHFSRPSTPHNSRPGTPIAAVKLPPAAHLPTSPATGYFPELQFSADTSKLGFILPTTGAKSEPAASKTTETQVTTPPTDSQPAQWEETPALPPDHSPTIPLFPQSRARRQSQRSIFPASDDSDRPSSRRSDKSFQLGPVPPLPGGYLSPQRSPISPNFNSAQFAENFHKWNPEAPVIRNSMVSQRSVSIIRPQEAHESSPHTRPSNVRASSVYSVRNSVLVTTEDISTLPRRRSPSAQAGNRHRRGRSSSSKHSTSRSLSRTQDSVRRQSRKLSVDRDEKRRSRDRDHLHYDPRQHSRDRSGSVQGRKVDFDHPRESPFSNIHATSDHSSSSSVSSNNSPKAPTRGPRRLEVDPMPQIPALDFQFPQAPQPGRLSVAPSFGRGRSASEVSQNSIGDFYDAYYRQSIMQQQRRGSNSVSLAPGHAIGVANGNGKGGRHEEFLMVGNAVSTNAKRPAPLKLNGGGWVGAETIVEVPSPLPGAGVGRERFPTRI